MGNVKLDFSNTSIKLEDIMEYENEVKNIHKSLHEKANDEKEFLGWLELPTKYDKKEFARIKKAAEKIKKDSDVFLCIGIGGSYLGARAVIESLTHTFYNYGKRNTPQILYAGNNLSPNYINDLIDLIGNSDFSVNVISKAFAKPSPK